MPKNHAVLESCPRCGGTIGTRPTADDGVLEDVCLNCGNVIETLRLKELLGRPLSRQPRRQKERPKTIEGLLDMVDPNWRYVIPKFFTRDPNPVLSSLFHNPFVGVWDFKDRTKPSQKSFKGYHESYELDRRRTDKQVFHYHIRRLIEGALTRFAYSTRGHLKRRKGLFAACLYVEAVVRRYRDIKVYGIRRYSVIPKAKKKWALRFKISKKTMMKRILEIEQETPEIGKMIDFLRRF